MFEQIFKGLFDSGTTAVIDVGSFLLCVGAALLLGAVLAAGYAYRTRYTKSFLVTLLMLPAVVSVVIMMVNGNIGTGVAIAGAFGLVRFRSVPGTAREICAIFLAMGAGLINGMGYLAYAALFTVLMSAVLWISSRFDFGTRRQADRYKVLGITIPEDLSYSEVFDDIFREYTTSCELTRVKTTNMGSMFRLSYDIVLKDEKKEKEMIDKLRCRNGNLEISVGRQQTAAAEL